VVVPLSGQFGARTVIRRQPPRSQVSFFWRRIREKLASLFRDAVRLFCVERSRILAVGRLNPRQVRVIVSGCSASGERVGLLVMRHGAQLERREPVDAGGPLVKRGLTGGSNVAHLYYMSSRIFTGP